MKMEKRMRAIFAAGFIAGFIYACTPQQRADAKTALAVAKYACIVAHALDPEPAVVTACGIVEDEVPIVSQLLSQQRAALSDYAGKQMSASHCSNADAGK